MTSPCSADPDKWFGYQPEGVHRARVDKRAITEARLACLLRCPLAHQRACAREAVRQANEYGVWAGVELPGREPRKEAELTRARQTLQDIADGVDPRHVRGNVELLIHASAHKTRAAS
jgi:WhiB family redox-sensing transcriptional regulator